jgi:hypothetical protein
MFCFVLRTHIIRHTLSARGGAARIEVRSATVSHVINVAM